MATFDTDRPDRGVTLAVTHGRATRGFLVAAGAAIVVLPGWDLWHGLWPPTAALPVFLAIVGGAMAIGLVFILGGIVGDSTELRAVDGWITLTRQNIFRREIRAVSPSEIVGIAVRASEWDSGPATFSVEVTIEKAGRVGAGEFTDAEAARRLARHFAAAAGRPDLAPRR